METLPNLETLRHSCAHVMAQAVKEIWPEVKVTIGPAIENGFYYDFDKKEPFAPEDLKQIEKKMHKIINANLPIKQSFMSRDEAKAYFSAQNETYKLELIDGIDDEQLSIYSTGDSFVDLCRGPHVEHTGEIKAFKLLSIAGAYWRGDENNARLQRIYGTCFHSKKELAQYLHMLEEAQKRDHRKLGTQLDLFNFYHETAGAGLVFYHPPGAFLRYLIENFVREEHIKRGYEFVMTPNILKGKLWVQSGHADHYRENMYFFDVDGEEYAVKPMNCPGHMLIYKSRLRSYRDLPIKFFELGTVYRQEKAGVLHGLLRVRGFTQDDAHIFCAKDQVKCEVMKVIDFVFDLMNAFGFKDMNIEVSTRPDDYIGDPADWDVATKDLEASLQEKELPYQINEGEGAFYGPKIDIKLKDALQREWQCATIQLDFSLPERFDLSYTNEKGEATRPIMIHRAIMGSVERFIGTLIEHYAGNFPVWLSPVQVLLIPIKDDHNHYAQEVKQIMEQEGLRVNEDCRNESLNKRIREGTLKKIPYIIILGDKEIADRTLAIRKRGMGDQGVLGIDDFLAQIKQEIQQKV